jgi:F-type H+-transporting ATPase subunit gamma
MIREVVSRLAPREATEEAHPLFQRREVRRIALVHMTTDRGLCGALNSDLNEAVRHFAATQSLPVVFVAVGRKGGRFLARMGWDTIAMFTGLSDRPTFADTLPVSRVVVDEYTGGAVDQVFLAYPRFVSTGKWKVTIELLLPVEVSRAGDHGVDYLYEPSPGEILDSLLVSYVESRLYQAIVELAASGHSARMVAMHDASNNARELADDITASLNKIRQETVTEEIRNITATARAFGEARHGEG